MPSKIPVRVADLSPGHKNKTTGVHGVGVSTVASAADVATHSALTTGVHGDFKTLIPHIVTNNGEVVVHEGEVVYN